jgi:membrane-bound ClpP family serine protease
MSRYARSLLFVAALLVSSAANADEATLNAGGAEAQRLYGEGMEAAKAERWADARDRFGQAFASTQHPQVAQQLGRAELALGDNRGAAEHLAFYLRNAKDVSAADKQTAQEMLDRARAKVAAVIVEIKPPGAEVRVDGKVVAKAPLTDPLFVEPGSREIEVRGAEGGVARTTFVTTAG